MGNSICCTEEHSSVLRNNENAIVVKSFDIVHDREEKFYCGRFVSKNGYRDPCGRCKGVCGPSFGCQCKSCFDLQIKQRNKQIKEIQDITIEEEFNYYNMKEIANAK